MSDLEGPDTRLQAGLESFPSRNNSKNAVAFKPSVKTAAVTQGLGSAPKVPKPLFSVKPPGALVMKRLDPDIEKRLNKKDLPVVDVVIDPMLSGRMRDHQKECVRPVYYAANALLNFLYSGIRFLYESVMGMRSEGQGCILADEM